MSQERYLFPFIKQDLSKKMVFLAGPRQVGKTTLAKHVAATATHQLYLSWDRLADRKVIQQADWPANPTMIVLDELHKYRHWKRWIKGEFDVHREKHAFMVTGSARLDVYRRGGDSLQGRYHHYRLHPFSVAELEGRAYRNHVQQELQFSEGKKETLENLLRFGGFPEPLFAQSDRELRRWQKEHLERFFREDVRDLENVHDFSSLQMLTQLLIGRGGSLLSLNSLREDLEVSHRAVTHWINILERLYFCFRVKPFHGSSASALKKMPKLYFWDWSLLEDEGTRFENILASHLLKFCHFLEDTEGHLAELWHLRDAQKREVDFLVTINKKPWFVVECKSRHKNTSSHLHYFAEKLKVPFAYQVSLEDVPHLFAQGIHKISAKTFLSAFV